MSSFHEDKSPTPPPLSTEEAAFRASFAKLVDWYRVSQLPVLQKAFLPAMLGFVPAGGTLVALGTSHNLPVPLRSVTTLFGILVIALGPIWCAYVLLTSIGNDRYVAIRVDGLAVKLDPRTPEALIPWEDLEDARYDAASDSAILTIRNSATYSVRERFADVTLPELTRRIRDARRLSVWQRLGPETNLR